METKVVDVQHSQLTPGQMKFEEIKRLVKGGMTVSAASKKIGVSNSFYSYHATAAKKRKSKVKKETTTTKALVPVVHSRPTTATVAIPLRHGETKKERKLIMVIGNVDSLAEFVTKMF